MKLTILIDNNTLIDKYYLLGEAGVSYLIEEGGKQILFDVGYSDAFIKNSKKLNLNLLDSDYVVLSHGHLDHTWGLEPLIKKYKEAKTKSLLFKYPILIAHPDIFLTKTINDIGKIGVNISENKLSSFFNINLSKEPFWLTNKLVFLGEIERNNNFENKEPVGKIDRNGVFEDDFLVDDSAVVYKSDQGLVIITGCSHSGICNIIEYAKKVCQDNRIVDIIGGFHLLDPSVENLSKTINYIENLNLKKIHACHCVDLRSKIELSKVVKLEEVGVGLEINYK